MKVAASRLRLCCVLLALTIVATLLLVITISLAVSIGEIAIPISTTAKAVSNRMFWTEFELNRIHEGVIWDYRLSRALVAASAGTSLALSGAILQALLRNPLAEPFVLGISAGASTGAVCVMVLGLGYGVLSLSAGAFIGAVAAFLVVGVLATGAGGSSERIILCGVAGSQLFNAVTSYIVTTSANAEQARGVLFWLLGSMSGVRWPDVYLSVPIAIAGCAVCLLHARALDAFAFGTDSAASLGVAVRKTQIVLFGATAIMTASVVSMVGSIGFVGLVIPHAVRFIVGPLHGRLLPATAVGGAVYMVGAGFGKVRTGFPVISGQSFQ